MSKAAQWVNTVLAPLGVRVQRFKRADGSGGARRAEFYKPTFSCQIPELATLYRLFLGEKHDGLFVEVGAYDGISFSNSSCLADVGWTGILIEPIPEFARACRDRYRGNGRIQVVEAAVGAASSNVEITVAGSLTTTNGTLLDRYRTTYWAKASTRRTSRLTVPQRTLDEILNAMVRERPIDVLIVDVEGAEAAVFAGFNLARWMPRMMIVELSDTHPDLHAILAGDADLQRSIERAGYAVVYKDSINTVFVSGRSNLPANPHRPSPGSPFRRRPRAAPAAGRSPAPAS
jgi:FkbM family methyltransferase